jgi:tetratricopeptide (TPR) repeat protein
MPRRTHDVTSPRRREEDPETKPPIRSSWWRALALPAGLVVVLALAAHAPALRGGFIWDDDVYVTANPYLQNPSGLYNIWFQPSRILQDYSQRGIDALIPLTFTTLWLEHRMWGMNPLGYHAVNIVLHGLCAALLWIVLRRIGVRGAWLAAALFAVHPITVESVAWIAELKNVQSGVFACLCVLAFFRFSPLEERRAGAGGRRWRFYALALLFFAAGQLTKPAVVTVPLVIVLVFWWRLGRVRSTDVVAVAPMLAMGLAMGLMTIHAEKQFAGASSATWQASLLERALIAGRALWFYVGKLVWPAGLTSVYPRWDVDVTAWWQFVFPLAAVAVLVALWLLRARLGRGPLVAALCFVVMVGPTLGFVSVGYHLYSFVADHFVYHAAPALIALFAAGVAALHERFRERRLALGVSAVGAVLLLVLGIVSWRHAQVFRSEKARCLDTIEHNPGAWMAMNNLGVVLASEGNAREAVRRYEDALKVRPEYAEAHNNMGVALVALGQPREAIEQYSSALRIWPTYAAAHNNMGTALASIGSVQDSIREYREALKHRPNYAEAHKNLGTALVSIGQVEEALQHYQKALRIRPEYAEAHNDLGLALTAVGRAGEAIGHYQQSLRIRPDDAETRNNLGMALAATGKPEEAIAQYREALRIKPDHGGALNNMGAALASIGKPQEAIRQYQEAVRVAPESAEAHNNLGSALASAGDLPAAILQYRDAVRIRPDYAEAHVNLGTALASTGALDDAVRHFQEAVRLKPNSGEARNNLGVCLARQGRLDEAIVQFEQALSIDPGDAGARGNLDRARGLSTRGDRPPGRR